MDGFFIYQLKHEIKHSLMSMEETQALHLKRFDVTLV